MSSEGAQHFGQLIRARVVRVLRFQSLNETEKSIARNRRQIASFDEEAWVKTLLEQTKSRTRGKYNVMVFNMQQNYDFNPPAGTFKFAQATFKGGLTGNITYGVWVFNSAATFTNKGEGGFIKLGEMPASALPEPRAAHDSPFAQVLARVRKGSQRP